MSKILLILIFIFSFVNANIIQEFPQLDGKIIDQPLLLSSKVKEDINSILTDHENRRKNEIEVVILKSLNGFEIENFSTLLMKHWETTKNDKKTVLVVISIAEEKVHIQVDERVRNALSEKIKNEIINYTLTPNLKAKQYELAILKTINEIILALQGEYIPKTNSDFSNGNKSDLLITVGYFGIVSFCMYINFICRNRRNLFFHISKSFIYSSLFGFLTFMISKEFTEYYLIISVTIFFLIFIINYVTRKNFKQKGANGGW